jgi:hypothetical protein
MTEKERFLSVLEREFPTTLKVLRAFPATKGESKPHAKARTTKDLAWTLRGGSEGGRAGAGRRH